MAHYLKKELAIKVLTCLAILFFGRVALGGDPSTAELADKLAVAEKDKAALRMILAEIPLNGDERKLVGRWHTINPGFPEDIMEFRPDRTMTDSMPSQGTVTTGWWHGTEGKLVLKGTVCTGNKSLSAVAADAPLTRFTVEFDSNKMTLTYIFDGKPDPKLPKIVFTKLK